MKNVEDVYPLSPMQQGMLFHSLCVPQSEVYIDQATCLLQGEMNVAAFQYAWGKVVERHAALRTAFLYQGLDEPLQIVRQKVSLPWDEQDWRNLNTSEQQAQLKSYLQADRKRGFDLTRAPLMRCAMLRMNERAWQFVWSFHHILLDGWCTSLLLKEVFRYYEAHCSGAELQLPRPRPYRYYIEWLKAQDMKDAEAYWRKRLAGFTAPTALGIAAPADGLHLSSSSYAEQQRYLKENTTSELEALARQQQVTLNTVVQGAWAVLLSRYSGETDVVFGATVSGRSADLPGVREMVGLFINTLPVRVQVRGEARLGEWLQQLQGEQAEMRQYEYSPLVEVQGWSEVERGVPLFETLMGFENYPVEQMPAGGSEPSSRLRSEQVWTMERTNYALTLMAGPGRQLLLKVLYEEQRLEAEAITRLLDHLEQLLESMIAGAGQRVVELRMLTAAEEEQLLVEWNQTASEYPREQCIHEVFEQQAALTPAAIAVVYEGEQLTYAELNARSNQLAHYLQKRGVGPETLVGVCLERSLEMVTALLGILKAGGAYLPLDPEYPRARLSYMLEEAGATILLTQGALAAGIAGPELVTVQLDQEWAAVAGENEQNLKQELSSEHLAYVSYTSGSTGRPKGVAVPHRGVLRLVRNTNYIELGPADVLSQIAPLSFDASTFELWGALLNGARLVVMRAGRPTLAELANVVVGQQVTTLWLTSGLFNLMVAEQLAALQGVKQVLTGGEVVLRSAVEQVLAEGSGVLIHCYGPTENTTFSCCQVLARGVGTQIAGATVPIGRAVANTRMYVVDEALQVVPVGVSGELLLGGDGLARGYLKQAEMTAASFIPDPFSGEADARLYRTGDVVRYRANGELEFVGRRDAQVKVRGYRIELGEVELALASHPAMKESVVLARSGSGDSGKSLIGYVVWREGEAVSAEELREYLSERLPEYMIPTQVVELEELPLKANGKVERGALPLPEEVGLGQGAEYVAPRTSVEEILANIWADVLGVERVGVHDSFFELGGHSLKATQIVSRVRESFQVELPLRGLFEAITLESFATNVELALRTPQQVEAPPLAPVSREQQLPLSFAQQRLWFLDQLDPFTATYNIPAIVRLYGPIRFSYLAQAVDEVVRRHEALRTIFVTERGRASQVICAPEPLGIPLIDLTNQPAAAQAAEVKRICAEEARQPFDLSTGPLLRVRLLVLGHEQHVLLMTMHHIISDGWSMGVLMRELIALYDTYRNGKPSPLSPLTIQYADYATWQRQWLQGAALEEQLAYWRKQLAGAPPVLELPTDHPRPAVQSYAGALLKRRLEAELLPQLESLSRREGLTLYMTLLAAFKLMLARYSGQAEVVVGTPIAGRTRSEIEGLIGFFVNTLVLRTKVDEEASVRQLLGRVRETCLGGYTHQEVPFEQLVEQLQPERDLSHQPLFQVMFELEGSGKKEGWQVGEIQVGFEESESEIAKFDLTLRVNQGTEGLEYGIEYKRDLFEETTIERMLGHVEAVLRALAKDVRQRVRDIELLSAAERTQLLVGWNQTRKEYEQAGQCIHQLFEQQAALRPKAIALVYENESLTYRELNRRSNQLAHQLRRLGVSPESLVGICVERSPEMIVGLLAILKAGGAYLPLDPEYPPERLSFMLKDSSASVLLTQQSLAQALSLDHPQPIYLDSAKSSFSDLPGFDPLFDIGPESLAYVIYTSGSTGRPKGVQIEHRTVVNFLSSMLAEPGLDAGDTLLAVTSLSFDIAALEILLPLVCGARMDLASREVATDGRRLKERLIESGATVMQATPATWRLLAAAGWDGLERVRRWCGGEALGRDLANQLAAEGNEVWNLYGPTETTIWSALWRVEEEAGEVLIGRPIANTELYVVDERMRVVPIGVTGELLIGGEGLSRGYLNGVELTAQRFIPDPFSKRSGARLYRTGDLARYRLEGTIECLGRLDNQVKIRGYRIELGEVEAALTDQEGVRESVVAVKEDSVGNKRLVAYLVTEPEMELNSIELRKALRNRLPDYMIPVRYMKLEQLPLTPNGKIDRKALPEPDREGLIGRSEYQAPRNHVEDVLTKIWASVLGVKQVGIHDNFFELGGDSILSIQIIAQAKEAGFQITPKDLFKHQTIASLAEIIGPAPLLDAEQGLIVGAVELTPGQRWFLTHHSIDIHQFNQALLLQVRQPVDPAVLREAAHHLFTHHDALRLRFRQGELGWQQFHAPAEEQISLRVIDLTTVASQQQRAAIESVAQETQASLSLSDGPLVRLVYFDLGVERPARLLIICHHLVIDGISWRILLEDLHTAYAQLAAGEQAQLPAKTTSFQHWAQMLKEYAGSEAVLAQAAYWNAPERAAVSSLPKDQSEGENSISSLQAINVGLSAEETRALLQEVPADYHTQINDVLLTALALVLSRWTGTGRVLVDMEGHGREQISETVDVSRTVGWFTTIYPVLLNVAVGGNGRQVGRAEELGEALKSVKEQLRQIPEPGLGYGLLRYLSADAEMRDTFAKLPQAEVIFNYSGQFDQALSGRQWFEMARENPGTGRSKRSRRWHLLEVSGVVVDERLQLTWGYSENIHRRSTIETVANEFIEILQELIRHCRTTAFIAITPSDFPEAELSQRELDELIAELT